MSGIKSSTGQIYWGKVKQKLIIPQANIVAQSNSTKVKIT